ncbi:MAG: hypothetical protein AB8G17_05680 [Gammaproteobacteria bacterium]
MTIPTQLTKLVIGAMLSVLASGCAPPPVAITQPLALQFIDSPASGRSGQAALNRSPDGQLVLSWLDHFPDDRVALRSADYADNGWHSQTTIATGSDWFVNWADFGAVVPLRGTRRLAHWRVRSGPATYAYDIHVALSSDQGRRWDTPFVLHRDGTRTEHGFVSVYPTANGAGIHWLDGRATDGGGRGHHATGGAMQLFNTVLGGDAADAQVVDARVCDCCQTASAMTDSGPLVAYRDRSDDEVRDIVVARIDSQPPTPPQTLGPDNWKIEGCPVNGPVLDASGDHVAIAWFTGADHTPTVQLAFSDDGGRRFGDALVIDKEQPVGRVDIVWLDANSVAISWVCTSSSDAAQLCLRRATASGDLSPIYTTVALDSSRRSGMPQMERSGDQLVFAWQAIGDTATDTYVRTAVLPISTLRP